MQLREVFLLWLKGSRALLENQWGQVHGYSFTFLLKERLNLTSIELTVTGAQAWAKVSGPLTSGMVGLPVTIICDEAWEGLTKNLVCRCSHWASDEGEIRTVLNVGDTATVAHEVMQADMYLHLGIEGFRADGKLVIPTTWAMCGIIRAGANTGEDLSADPTLPVWNQLQVQIEQLECCTFPQEQVEEIRAFAEAAARSEENALAASERAAENADETRTVAHAAQMHMESAKTSAASAANMANDALRFQQAAVDAAIRAEAAAGSCQNNDYAVLENKPSINGVALIGDKTAVQLGIGQPTEEQVGDAVGDWLEAHPEATTVVADRSITAAKTTFIEPVVQNLIDISKVVKGGIAEATGAVGVNTGYSTDYIAVEVGKKYRCNIGFGTGGNWTSWYYDAAKMPLSIVESNPFTVPDGAAFVRLSWYFTEDPAVRKYALFEGENIWPFTQGIQRYELDGMLTKAVERVVDAYAAVKAVPKNLYKQAGYGSVDGSTGAVVCGENGMLRVSDYIEITPGVCYISNCLSAPNFTACYDSGKNYVAAFADAAERFYTAGYHGFRITDPNVRYIVNGCEKAISKPITEPFICRGSTVPETFDGYDVAVPQADVVPALKKLLGVTGSDLAGLTWAVLGDSTTAGSGNTQTYHSIIAEALGLTAINYGVNGSWVSYTAAMDGQEMCTRFETMTDDADIITVMGGINDTNNGAALGQMGDTEKATFYGALDILCQGLHRKYPGKRIGYITPMNYGDDAKAEPYLEAIRKVCGKYAIPVLDMYHDGLICAATEELSGIYFRDGLHQNDFGQAVMARKVGAFLKAL